MPPTDPDWAKGYSTQALSDLNAREILAKGKAHKCHRLHFLQMAAEKVCKAHLTISNGHENVRRTHAYPEKYLPIIARYFYPIRNDNNAISQWEISAIKKLAREIEVLAPACDDQGTRAENTEYPWADPSDQVRIPCEHTFPNIDDYDRTTVRLIRLLRTAAEAYL